MSTITVSTLTGLNAALSAAQGGETILLEGGNYGALVMNSYIGPNPDFASNVTIASADINDPAVFTSVRVHDGSNVTFDGITFDYEFGADDPIYENNFLFSGVDNLTIKNSTFEGDLAEGISVVDDGFAYGQGAVIRFSSGVTFENNEVSNFHRGVAFAESSDIIVSDNDIHSMRMDGITFSEVSGVTIEDNYIHDFRGSPDSDDHTDMIQFWTTGTDNPSTDIIIRGNTLDIGEGTPTQSLFMRNERVDLGQAGQEMYYHNVTITDNTIVNAHLHGITVGETNGLTISSNTLVHRDGALADGVDASVEIPRINVTNTSHNVTITDNATAGIEGQGNRADWTISNNTFIQNQDPNAEGHYDDAFVVASLEQDQVQVQPAPIKQTDDVVALEITDNIELSSIGVAGRIDRSEVDFLPNSDAFSIDFSLLPSAQDDFGEVFRLHGSIHIYVQPDGHLRVRASSSDGQVTQISSNEELFTGKDITAVNITLEDGVLSLSIDGSPAVTAVLDGNLGSLSNHDLVFGNPWDQDNFTGTVEDFRITTPGDSGQPDEDDGIVALLDAVFEDNADGMLPIYDPQAGSSPSPSEGPVQGRSLPFDRIDPDGMQYRSDVIDKFDTSQNEVPIWSPEDN